MSNLTFDIKCIKADPQSGICETASSGGGNADFAQGTYTPTVTLPVPGVGTNALTMNGVPTGIWSRVNNRYTVQIIVSFDYVTGGPLADTGYALFSLPVPQGPNPEDIPVGLGNWFDSGSSASVLGTVFPQGAPAGEAELTLKPFPGGASSGTSVVSFMYNSA